FVEPPMPLRRVGERLERNRRPRSESAIAENPQRPFEVGGLQIDDEVQIECRARISMQHNSHALDDEVPDLSLIEVLQQFFDLAHHSSESTPMTDRRRALELLRRIERESAYATLLLQNDSGFVRTLVLGVLRWRSRLDFAVQSLAKRAIDPEVIDVLRLGAYQLLFM